MIITLVILSKVWYSICTDNFRALNISGGEYTMGRYAYADYSYDSQSYKSEPSSFSGFSYQGQQRLSIKSDVKTEDVLPIAELIVDNQMVILDLSKSEDPLHIIDTLAGVAYGNNSSVTSIAKSLYLIAPSAVNVMVQD